MLEGSAEVLIVSHGLIISSELLDHLLLEDFSLDEGVIEFREGVAELVVVDEQFESFGELGLFSVVLGEWGHDLWVLSDEGWVFAVDLNEFSDLERVELKIKFSA